jgi:thioredoxin-like negative regulator of GroEL
VRVAPVVPVLPALPAARAGRTKNGKVQRPNRKDMSEKTRKQQLEEMLAEDPGDAFLRYGLAMEYLGEGDARRGAELLQALLRDDPGYVPAYYQAGKALIELGEEGSAQALLGEGITRARSQGNAHAADEMEMLLDSIR